MDAIIDFAKKQGFSTALLLTIAYILNGKIERLEAMWRNCESEKFQIISDIAQKCNSTIDKNTTALERNTEAIETIQAYFGDAPTIHKKKRLDPLTARQGIK